AVAKLGASTVPVSFRLHPAERASGLADTRATLLFVSTSFAGAAGQALEQETAVRETFRVPTLAERLAGEGGDLEELVTAGAPGRVTVDIGDDDRSEEHTSEL